MIDLQGKRGLVIGIANDHSIAWGCAKAFRAAGAELAVTYLNDKAKKFVAPLAEELNAAMLLPLDITNDTELEALFAEIDAKWDSIDFILHSIAFAPLADLHGRVVESSREGFGLAMDISCHSLLRVAKYAESRMKNGGSILTMTYDGSNHVAPHYGIMGPVKAALEASVRSLAVELGPKQISVNAISPGPIATRAGSGIKDFGELLQDSIDKDPLGRLVTIEEVGALATLLASTSGRGITGDVIKIDAGRSIIY